jgi:hypothetical protein
MASERILCTGTIVAGGEVQWSISPLTGEVEISDGDIQRMIDEAADTEAYEEDLLDRMYWSRGDW